MDSLITFLNTTGKPFVDFAGPMLIQSSLLIIVLLALDWLLRKKVRAVFRYCIWMLILVKLVLPATLSSPTSLGYWFADKLPGIATQKPSIPRYSPPILPHIEPVAENTPPLTTLAASPPAGTTHAPVADIPTESIAAPSPPTTASLSWQGFAFLSWLAAVIAMALLLIQRMFFVRGLLAQSKNPNDAMLNTFEQCRKQIKIHGQVNLKLSPVTASPSVCGLFRPTILIPHNLPSKLNAEDLKSILLHELAHIKRGDLWINLIQALLQIAYFYNPLLWLANAIIRRIREQAVDEMVLVAMGARAENYPQTLLNISRLTFSRPALSLRLIGVVESKKALTSRIKHILSRPFPKSAKLGFAGMIAIIITAAILLPMAKGNFEKAPSPKEEASSASDTIDHKPEPNSKFIATLTNDVTVELISVCKAKDNQRCWGPNGSLFSKAPYYKSGAWAGSEAFEFAFRVKNLDVEQSATSWKIDGKYATTSGNRGHPTDEAGKRIADLWVIDAKIIEGVQKCDISFGVAADPWQTQAKCVGIQGMVTAKNQHPYTFSQAYVHNNMVCVTVSDNMVKLAKRLIAIDNNGKTHLSELVRTGSTKGLRQSTFGFNNLKFEDIKEFQFQTQPYQWTEFKNVSLKPNFKTNVQIEVEKDADQSRSPRGYRLRPGDIVQISVYELYREGQEAIIKRQVSGNGQIALPFLDEMLKAEGMTQDELREAITQEYKPNIIRHPFVSVMVLERGEIEVENPAAQIAYWVDFEITKQGFLENDWIKITQILGPTYRLPVGQTYTIKGKYKLSSRGEARLHLYATNGETRCKQGPIVKRGTGEFTRTFTYLKDGWLHLSFYPAYERGSSFGNLYFAEKGSNQQVPDISRITSVVGDTKPPKQKTKTAGFLRIEFDEEIEEDTNGEKGRQNAVQTSISLAIPLANLKAGNAVLPKTVEHQMKKYGITIEGIIKMLEQGVEPMVLLEFDEKIDEKAKDKAQGNSNAVITRIRISLE